MNVLLNRFPFELIEEVVSNMDSQSVLNLFISLHTYMKRDANSYYLQTYLYNYIQQAYNRKIITAGDIIQSRYSFLFDRLLEWGFKDWKEGMYQATLIDSLPLVEFFIDKGAHDWTVGITAAIESSSIPMAEFFLAKARGARIEEARTEGSWQWVNMMMSFGLLIENGMHQAAKNNSPTMVDFFISKGASNWNWRMTGAAIAGSFPLVNLFIEKGANDWNSCIAHAVKSGSIPMVDLFVSKGADNWNGGLAVAAETNNMPLIEYFIAKGADDWNNAMCTAISKGYIHLVDFFIAKGADDWNGGMSSATQLGSLELIEMFILKGANDWNMAATSAIRVGNIKMVEFFIKKGANNWNTFLRHLMTSNCSLPLVKLLVEKGANNFRQAIDIYKMCGPTHPEITEYLEEKEKEKESG